MNSIKLCLSVVVLVALINPVQLQLETLGAVLSVIPITSLLSTAGLVTLKLALISRLLGMIGIGSSDHSSVNLTLPAVSDDSSSSSPSQFAALVPLDVLKKLGINVQVDGQTGPYVPPGSPPTYVNYAGYQQTPSPVYPLPPSYAAGYAVDSGLQYAMDSNPATAQPYGQAAAPGAYGPQAELPTPAYPSQAPTPSEPAARYRRQATSNLATLSNSQVVNYFALIRQMDEDGCLAKMVCEIGGNSTSYGAYGATARNFFETADIPSFNSTNVDYYADAYNGGKQNLSYCTKFDSCKQDVVSLAQLLNMAGGYSKV